MSDDPRPYRAGPIEPVVAPGQNVLLASTKDYWLYQVAYIEPIPRSHPLVANIGAIVAGAVTPVFNTQAILDMAYGQLGQFRAAVLDDIHATVLQPQSLARYGLQNINATLNAFGALHDPCAHQTEFYIFERDRVFLRATNPTGFNLAQARVAFWGYRYILLGKTGVAQSGEHTTPLETYHTIEDAVKSGQKFTVIPVGGWGA